MLAVAVGLIAIAPGLGWGLAWTTLVPAIVLCAPAAALVETRLLVREGDGALTIRSGLFGGRHRRVPPGGWELEVVPTAGARAVVVHRDDGEFLLASWIRPSTAARLAAWCDRSAPDGAWPRRETRKPEGDR